MIAELALLLLNLSNQEVIPAGKLNDGSKQSEASDGEAGPQCEVKSSGEMDTVITRDSESVVAPEVLEKSADVGMEVDSVAAQEVPDKPDVCIETDCVAVQEVPDEPAGFPEASMEAESLGCQEVPEKPAGYDDGRLEVECVASQEVPEKTATVEVEVVDGTSPPDKPMAVSMAVNQ